MEFVAWNLLLQTIYTIPMPPSTGSLYIVSTPIGNLDDFSPRAKRTLSSVDYVLCESTDQTRKLGVTTSLLRYEGKGYKSEIQKKKVVDDLIAGKNIALVSNAGTPLISDPGLSLVQIVVAANLPVVNIPGPVAFISALVTSGLPTKNILFIGYLSKKSAAIEKSFLRAKSALAAMDEPTSLVCYVSKYQLILTLEIVKKVFGEDTTVNLSRELTKIHEEHKTGTIVEVISWLNASPNRQKGEFTLIVDNS